MQQLTPRQAEIVEAAMQLISEVCIQRLTMKRIAKGVGISEPALYRHFKSKMDILLTLLASFRRCREAIMARAQATSGDVLERVFALFGAFTEHFSEHPTSAALIFSEAIFQDDQRLSSEVFEMMQSSGDALTTMLTEGQTRGEVRADLPAAQLCNILMGSFRLLVSRWHLSGHQFKLETESEALCDTLRTMIQVETDR